MDELAHANRNVNIEALRPGQVLQVPVLLGLQHFSGVGRSAASSSSSSGSTASSSGGGGEGGSASSGSNGSTNSSRDGDSSGGSSSAGAGNAISSAAASVYSDLGIRSGAAAAVAHALAGGEAARPGAAVAVKVQYPSAAGTMKLDLVSLRSFAGFLSKTEIQFDMVSAVDELYKQIDLELDFTR